MISGKLVLLLIFSQVFECKLLKENKPAVLRKERKLTLNMTKNDSPKGRKLSGLFVDKRDELEEDYANQRSVNQMKMMMSSMKRDNEVKNIEMQLNEIGDEVEDINETMMAKLSVFMGLVERVKAQKKVERKMYNVKY